MNTNLTSEEFWRWYDTQRENGMDSALVMSRDLLQPVTDEGLRLPSDGWTLTPHEPLERVVVAPDGHSVYVQPVGREGRQMTFFSTCSFD